jgi:hypothetical protein
LKRIETLKDIVDSDSYIELDEGTSYYNYMKNSNDTIALQVIEKWNNQEEREFPVYDGESDYRRIVYHPKTLRFTDDDHIEYAIMSQFSTPSGRSSVYIGKQRIQPSGYGFPMTKGSPLNNEISRSYVFLGSGHVLTYNLVSYTLVLVEWVTNIYRCHLVNALAIFLGAGLSSPVSMLPR